VSQNADQMICLMKHWNILHTHQ